jgi:hypothetical protein
MSACVRLTAPLQHAQLLASARSRSYISAPSKRCKRTSTGAGKRSRILQRICSTIHKMQKMRVCAVPYVCVRCMKQLRRATRDVAHMVLRGLATVNGACVACFTCATI